MRWAVILAVLAAVCWASVSTSAPCRLLPAQYGLDCSPMAYPTPIVFPESVGGSGCTIPAVIPCEIGGS